MTSHHLASAKKLLLNLALLLLLYSPAPASENSGYFNVRAVIDGDTIVLRNGERVRYLGIDTPEAGEPFYREAKERNRALVAGRRVRLEFCEAERRDRYGRLLAFVEANGVDVNRTLLAEGLARKLLIPPCGLIRGEEFKSVEKEAKARGLGLWGQAPPSAPGGKAVSITPGMAVDFTGTRVRVKGLVMDVKRGKGAFFLVFGKKEGSFEGVIFNKDMESFTEKGVNPFNYKGKMVEIAGTVRSFKGRPEIIIKGPSQLTVY